jgi:hypothetical protein
MAARFVKEDLFLSGIWNFINAFMGVLLMK